MEGVQTEIGARPSRSSIVVFAHVPPPDHGQSRMVALTLGALSAHIERLEVLHIDARYSDDMDEVGGLAVKKLKPLVRFLGAAIKIRFKHRPRTLYYIPGPVKWSAVVRDWINLIPLRLLYPRLVCHWHAIGQGEWAKGSTRLALSGPGWLDQSARLISRIILDRPHLSIVVTANSARDARALRSRSVKVVANGIEDPCPLFWEMVAPVRHRRAADLSSSPDPQYRLLFLAHGTVEKGLFDALEAIRLWLGSSTDVRVILTLAGGTDPTVEDRLSTNLEDLQLAFPGRLTIDRPGFVNGDDKRMLFEASDVFLATSRWESFGLSVVEAMAYGLPVVATLSDGVQGVLPEGYPYAADVGDSEGLAESIRKCIDCRDAPIGQDLRKRFESRFQLGSFQRTIAEVLLKATEAGPGAAETST